MSPKKSPRSQAAQQLIENLLDELPSSKAPDTDLPGELLLEDGNGSFGPIEVRDTGNAIIEGLESSDDDGIGLALEGSSHNKVHLDPIAQAHQTMMLEKQKRLSDADSRVVTPPAKKSKPVPPPTDLQTEARSKIVRPKSVEIVREDVRRLDDDVDFGEIGSQGASSEVEPVPSPGPTPHDDERTIRVAPNSTLVSPPETRADVITGHFKQNRPIDRGGATEIRSGVKIPPSPKYTGAASSAPTSIEAALKQSESLRIAQDRIVELERELERVRRDNEQISTAGDTLRRRADELAGRAESLEIQTREMALRLDEEKKVLRGQLQQKERDNAEMRARVDEIETRLESNFKKIRVRERELEHRLEIVKVENATVISTKDKMLLDLKRQIDQLHHESDSAKNKSQELFSQYKEKQETIRRVVRALRIALTILEGDDESMTPLKKAD